MSCFQPPGPASHSSWEGRRHPSTAPLSGWAWLVRNRQKEDISWHPTICSPVVRGRLGVVMQVQRTGMATLKSNQISADFGQFRIDVFQKGEKCGDLQKPRAHWSLFASVLQEYHLRYNFKCSFFLSRKMRWQKGILEKHLVVKVTRVGEYLRAH